MDDMGVWEATPIDKTACHIVRSSPNGVIEPAMALLWNAARRKMREQREGGLEITSPLWCTVRAGFKTWTAILAGAGKNF